MARNNKKPAPPKAMSIRQASDFWDEHSLLEFDGTEEIEAEFKLKRKKYIGLSHETFNKLHARARRKKTTPEALLESWIAEKVG